MSDDVQGPSAQELLALPRLAPLVPMLYVAWTDGELTPEELRALGAAAKAQPWRPVFAGERAVGRERAASRADAPSRGGAGAGARRASRDGSDRIRPGAGAGTRGRGADAPRPGPPEARRLVVKGEGGARRILSVRDAWQ